MKINRDEVEHVAHLSRLALTDAELAGMQKDLTEILENMRTLEELEGYAPSSDARNSLCNVTREDVIRPSVDRAKLLINAPVHHDESIIVPKTVE